MKFGIRFIETVGTPRQLVDLTVRAERAGFEYVWFPHDPFMAHTWMMTAAVAEHTDTILIGSVGTNPYTTDASEIATYLATLDQLSEGRAVSGLGLHTTEMVAWTGYDASNVIERTREAVDIIRALFAGETVVRQTREYQWSDQCYFRFDPFKREIPIYVSAFGEDYLHLSGEIGDGSLPMITPPESASVMVPPIIRGMEAAGRAPGAVDIAGCAWLSLSQDGSGTTDLIRPMAAYFGVHLEEVALKCAGLCRADFAEIAELVAGNRYAEAHAAVTQSMFDLAITGDPDEVIARIEKIADLGVTQINLGGPIGPDPAAAIELMGRHVIPHFRSTN
jgi:5,10-methylenetetrahydromethanopterin reductase